MDLFHFLSQSVKKRSTNLDLDISSHIRAKKKLFFVSLQTALLIYAGESGGRMGERVKIQESARETW